jgi:hypothetical protein
MLRDIVRQGFRILFGIVLAAAAAMGQEVAVPDKPVPSTITSYKIIAFSQEREPDWRFVITFQDSNGKVYRDEHHGLNSLPNPAGDEPINNPEGADAFLKQVQHGKIPPSSVTGTPESAQ